MIINISHEHNHKVSKCISNQNTYYEVTQRDKRSLIFESVRTIRIDVHPIGENLTHTTYARQRTGHV
jgi:hypothetical protein